MFFFALGFALCLLLNAGYIFILWFNARHGEKASIVLYGLTLPADFGRFRRILVNTGRGRWFSAVIAAFVILTAVMCIALWLAVRQEAAIWK